MAKRAGAKSRAKSGGDAAARAGTDAESRLVEAALRLAAEQGWRGLALAQIAAAAGLPLDEAYAACASKHAILAAFQRRIDRAALSGPAAEQDASDRDRLFDVLMRRFDALAPHRPALRAILRDSMGDPAALAIAPTLWRSMAWMLEAAGLSTLGWRGGLRIQVLSALYLWVLRDFLNDESADLARTMAALDRGLRRAQSFLSIAGSAPGGSDANPG